MDAPPGFAAPVPYVAPPAAAQVSRKPAKAKKSKKARRRWGRTNHEYALDLFTPEGTPVRSATRGVVVLADKTWTPGDPFSTTSQKGGNTVIVFDPDGDRFFRYAHLDQVPVSAGQIVHAGEVVGTVGHTGLNASRPKHGGHLHLEVNQFEGGQVRALGRSDLWTILRSRDTTRVQAP